MDIGVSSPLVPTLWAAIQRQVRAAPDDSDDGSAEPAPPAPPARVVAAAGGTPVAPPRPPSRPSSPSEGKARLRPVPKVLLLFQTVACPRRPTHLLPMRCRWRSPSRPRRRQNRHDQQDQRRPRYTRTLLRMSMPSSGAAVTHLCDLLRSTTMSSSSDAVARLCVPFGMSMLRCCRACDAGAGKAPLSRPVVCVSC